jgi:hypothetical protein
MSLVRDAFYQASLLFNVTTQTLPSVSSVSSSSSSSSFLHGLNMISSIFPLLISALGLSDATYLDSRQPTSSKVPDYFQTYPQIFAGKLCLLSGVDN